MERFRFPDSLVLIFAMIFLAWGASFLLPSGEYETKTNEKGREVVVPNTYETLPKDDHKLTWHAWLTKIPKGLEKAQDIIFFVFLVGGVIGILKATGCFDALIGTAIQRASGSTVLLIGLMVSLFAVGSSTIGMAEEYMPFIPVLVTMCIALGMDAVVAVGIVYIGSGIGYGCAAINPFTVQIAQGIAELPPTSGQLFRWVLLVVCLIVGIHHLLAYVRKIRKDPSRSLVKDVDYSEGYEMPEDTAFTTRRILVLLVFVGGIGIFVWGVSQFGWYLTELAGIFLGMGILAAIIAGMSPNTTAHEFIRGAAELTGAALLIGFARTIEVVLEDSKVIHTIVHGIANTLEGTAPEVAASGMLAVQSACNFLIPSGSGQAYVTMPIMTPLSDLVGVSRQSAVLAYQFGDGFTNMIVPTNALLMGMLGLGRIPFQRWVRFILPLLLKLYLVAIIALVIAVRIGY